MQDRITRILERWFIQEPALFGVACSHELVPAEHIACAVRCGRGKIEYNPSMVAEMCDEELEEALRSEAVRILLKHPYERKPDQCSQQAISIGSNLVIGDNYQYGSYRVEKPGDYDLESGRQYEWYSRRIQEMLQEDEDRFGDGAEANTALSELWDEDELMVAKINSVIEATKNWGSLGGSFAELIKASKAKINWRNAFAGFRASILTERRKATRMKPSRRFGFDQMGSQREFTTKLLIAVDVSGSVSSQNLSYFYGVVNSAFRYGFTAVDVVEFDAGITKVTSLKQKMKEVTALGRGGTSFDEPVLFAHMNKYDGLLILTDGYAPPPTIPDGFKTKILWACQDQESYDTNHTWMEQSGRVCIIQLL